MKIKVLSLVAVAGLSAISTAHFEIFAGSLMGISEVPPNASPGTGFTTVTIDMDLITMRVESTFSGLTGTTTASHIHVGGGPGTNGGVASQTPSFIGFPLGVTSGNFDATYNMALASSYNPTFIANNGGTVSNAFNALVNALRQGRAYHNIHTSTFPGGEIRADLVPVPEPASMSALALGAAAMLRRRKKN